MRSTPDLRAGWARLREWPPIAQWHTTADPCRGQTVVMVRTEAAQVGAGSWSPPTVAPDAGVRSGNPSRSILTISGARTALLRGSGRGRWFRGRSGQEIFAMTRERTVRRFPSPCRRTARWSRLPSGGPAGSRTPDARAVCSVHPAKSEPFCLGRSWLRRIPRSPPNPEVLGGRGCLGLPAETGRCCGIFS